MKVKIKADKLANLYINYSTLKVKVERAKAFMQYIKAVLEARDDIQNDKIVEELTKEISLLEEELEE